jgi:hypothetical protein
MDIGSIPCLPTIGKCIGVSLIGARFFQALGHCDAKHNKKNLGKLLPSRGPQTSTAYSAVNTNPQVPMAILEETHPLARHLSDAC